MSQPRLSEKIEKVLLDFKNFTPDVEGVVLVDMNGLPITSVLNNDSDDSHVSAMAAAMLGMGERIVGELSKGSLTRVLVQGEKGCVIFIGAGDEAMLTVLTNESAKLGIIFVDALLAAGNVSKILSAR
jgi:uncharacterized protein